MSDGIVDSAESGLKGKIGPVPVWLIAAILGVAAVGGYYVYSKRSNTTASSDTTDASSSAVTTDTADGSIAGTSGTGVTDSSYATTGSGAAYNIPDSTDASSTTAATNAGWLISGANAVAAHGSAGYVDSFVALTKYINGDTITSGQKNMVDYAISIVGYPPEGLNGISTVADPVETVAATSAPATSTADTPAAASSPAPATAAAPASNPTPSSSSGTVVKVTNPVKDTAAKYGIDTQPLNTAYTMLSPHKKYPTAADANAQKNSNGTVNPGAYTLVNRQKLSSGYVVLVTSKSGSTSGWINV